MISVNTSETPPYNISSNVQVWMLGLRVILSFIVLLHISNLYFIATRRKLHESVYYLVANLSISDSLLLLNLIATLGTYYVSTIIHICSILYSRHHDYNLSLE